MQFKSPFTMQNAAKVTGNGQPMQVGSYSSASLQITGTFVGTIAFEASIDNINWVPIIGKRIDQATQTTTTSDVSMYSFSVRGIQFIRARVSAYTSGEITVVGVASEAPFGSPEADFANATLQAAAAANGNGTAMDVQGYASVLFNVTGTFSATVTFQGTADGTNYFGINAQNITDATQGSATTAAGLFAVGVNGMRKIRAVVSSYASGAVTVSATALPVPYTPVSTATLSATVDNVKIKNAAGTNTLEPDEDGQIGVKVNGSLPTLYGATVATRPAANMVAVGQTWKAVTTQEMWQSDGTNWVVI
jgi:hypothetical protein